MKGKMKFVESSHIGERVMSHKSVPAPAIFPFTKTVVVEFVIKSASIEVWFATNTCFGVTKQHRFATKPHEFVTKPHEFVAKPHEFVAKPHEFVTKPHEFVTRPHEFVTKPHEFVTKQHSFLKKKLGFVAETLTTINR